MPTIHAASSKTSAAIFRSARRLFTLTALCALSACAPEGVDEEADVEDEAIESAYRTGPSGFTTSSSCGDAEDRKIKAAWNYLTVNLRGPLRAQFAGCVQSASLVEVGCDDQLNRQRLIDDVLADQVFQVECVDFPVETDANGHRVFTNAEAAVGIRGTKMRADKTFLRLKSTVRVAAVMAHELMHNRGYQHAQNERGSWLYPLTVPEQIEACVQDTKSGTGPNQDPAGHLNAATVCAPDNHWCDATGCFKTVQTCAPELNNYCWITVTYEDGSPVPPEVGNIDIRLGI